MTRSQANRIEEILRTQDMRSPRVTLDAVAAILDETPSIMSVQAKSEQANPGIASAFEKLMATMMASAEESDVEIPHLAPDDVKNEFGNLRPGEFGVVLGADLARALRVFTGDKVTVIAPLRCGQTGVQRFRFGEDRAD